MTNTNNETKIQLVDNLRLLASDLGLYREPQQAEGQAGGA